MSINILWLKKSVGKNGSFDFAAGLASCVGAKANVPWVKKLKHIWIGNECRVVCLLVSFFILSLIFHFTLEKLPSI